MEALPKMAGDRLGPELLQQLVLEGLRSYDDMVAKWLGLRVVGLVRPWCSGQRSRAPPARCSRGFGRQLERVRLVRWGGLALR